MPAILIVLLPKTGHSTILTLSQKTCGTFDAALPPPGLTPAKIKKNSRQNLKKNEQIAENTKK